MWIQPSLWLHFAIKLELLFPYTEWVVFFWLLSRFFSSSLIFSSLHMIYLGVIFFKFTCSRFIELLKSINLCLSPNLVSFQPLFLQKIFSVPSLSLSGLQGHKCWTRKKQVPMSLRHVFFPIAFSVYSTDWIISTVLISLHLTLI